MNNATPILTAACLALGACGGTSGTDARVLPSGPADYRALTLETAQLGDRLQALDPVLPPVSNSARYRGALALVEDIDTGQEGYYGRADLTANFSTDILTGVADGFYYDTRANSDAGGAGEPVPGSVTLFADDFNSVVDVSVQGNVDFADVDGNLDALFFGPNAEMISGRGDDSITIGTETGWDAYLIAD